MGCPLHALYYPPLADVRGVHAQKHCRAAAAESGSPSVRTNVAIQNPVSKLTCSGSWRVQGLPPADRPDSTAAAEQTLAQWKGAPWAASSSGSRRRIPVGSEKSVLSATLRYAQIHVAKRGALCQAHQQVAQHFLCDFCCAIWADALFLVSSGCVSCPFGALSSRHTLASLVLLDPALGTLVTEKSGTAL
eukprot:scaffold1307_cov200-Pinguiococcus_pyrenoidosus.AAC.6